MLTPRARARLARSPSAIAGAAVVAALALFAAVGPVVARHGPLESDFVRGVTPSLSPVGPCLEFPLGADHLFRDVLARLAYAGRLSLTISVAATAVAAALGTLVGVLAGWYEGRGARIPWTALAGGGAAVVALADGHPQVAAAAGAAGAIAAALRRSPGPRVDVDGWLMRCVDVMLAFPFLLLVMALAAALDRTNAATLFVTLGATGWLGIARVLRAKTMQVRALEFVEAARALGQSTPVILWRARPAARRRAAHRQRDGARRADDRRRERPQLPRRGHLAAHADLGTHALRGAGRYLVMAPWLIAAPAAAILLSVWGFNMLGEGLRDALDPTDA